MIDLKVPNSSSGSVNSIVNKRRNKRVTASAGHKVQCWRNQEIRWTGAGAFRICANACLTLWFRCRWCLASEDMFDRLSSSEGVRPSNMTGNDVAERRVLQLQKHLASAPQAQLSAQLQTAPCAVNRSLPRFDPTFMEH